MSETPFGSQHMKCPECGQYTGEFIGDEAITIYRMDTEIGSEQIGESDQDSPG